MKYCLKSVSFSVILIVCFPSFSDAQSCSHGDDGHLECSSTELIDQQNREVGAVVEQSVNQSEAPYFDVYSVNSSPFGLDLGTDNQTTEILTEILDASQQHAALILRYMVKPDELPPSRLKSRLVMGDAPENDSLKNAMRSMILAGDYAAALTLYEEFHDSESELIVAREAVLVEIVADESEPEPRLIVATWFDASDLLTRNENPDVKTTLHLDGTGQTGLFQMARASSYFK